MGATFVHTWTFTARRLRRHGALTLLHVAGLGLGLACCAFIALWVRDELRYDRFHERADRVYRVTLDLRFGDQETHTAMTPPGLAPTLERALPAVERAVRLWRDPSGAVTVRHADRAFPEPRVLFADADVFDVFSFPLVRGDPETALRDPYSVVLTESTARKYFGDEDPLGQTLALREPSDRDVFDYRVTGIAADPPAQSHLPFDLLASAVTQRWSRSDDLVGFGLYTYVLIREGADAEALARGLPAVVEAHVGPQVRERLGASYDAFREAGNRYRLGLQPLGRIHLHSRLDDEPAPGGDVRYVYLFSAVAVCVLLLACANFVTLATAQAAGRAREVGVRKALGSGRGRLVRQFLAEALLLSFLALGLAVALVAALLPALSGLAGKDLAASLPGPGTSVVLLAGAALVVGLAAGTYPALVLSAFRPMAALRPSHGGYGSGRRAPLRSALVVFQFAVAVVLVAGTLVVDRQMRHVQERRLGFEAERVVVLEGAEVMGRRIEAFKERLLALPGVARVTNSELVPGRPFSSGTFHVEGADEDRVPLRYTYAGFGFVETLGLELVEGRSLSRAFAGDSLAVLLNETAVRRLGLEEPVGQRLVWPGESTYTVVGVVRDFHTGSLREEIGPVALLGPDPRNTNRPNLLVAARVASEDVPRTLAAVEATWRAFAPGHPFTYRFLDDTFDALYRADRLTGRLFAGFAAVALLIACFGLFGLATYVAHQRTKEVGVRKVLGATTLQIVTLLSKDFARLLLIAAAVAMPAAYAVTDRWLGDFAYRVDIGPGVFVAAGVVAAMVAMLAVISRAYRAAVADPVESLRSE